MGELSFAIYVVCIVCVRWERGRHLDVLTELESWLQFPIDYAEGITLLSELTTSPSYQVYVDRVAEVALKSPDDVANDVSAYLASSPKRVRIVEKVPRQAHASALVSLRSSALARRCLYCHHTEFYQRKDSRMTHNGVIVFVFLLIMALPFALIPYFFMREEFYTEFCKACNRKQDID